MLECAFVVESLLGTDGESVSVSEVIQPQSHVSLLRTVVLQHSIPMSLVIYPLAIEQTAKNGIKLIQNYVKTNLKHFCEILFVWQKDAHHTNFINGSYIISIFSKTSFMDCMTTLHG